MGNLIKLNMKGGIEQGNAQRMKELNSTLFHSARDIFLEHERSESNEKSVVKTTQK